MRLPRSSYYYKSQEPAIDDQVLIACIEELVEEFSGYGYRRITAQLHRERIQVNHKKVLRLLRERELLCKPKHRRVKTTNSNHTWIPCCSMGSKLACRAKGILTTMP